MKQILILFLILFGFSQAKVEEFEIPPRIIEFFPRRLFSSRIVNGSPAEIENHPHHISLHERGFYFCGGSIIAPNFALSAAHCLRGARPQDILIHAGSNNRYAGDSFEIEIFWLHPEFDTRTLERDIGIMRTFRALIGSNISPIKLPAVCEAACCGVCEGTNMTVSGFGRTELGSSSQWLRQVSKPVFNFAECDRIWRITNGMFCTDATRGDSCSGDSGGPVVDNNGIQHGVVSFGSANCDGSAPAVYVRLEAPINRHWIQLVAGI
ncbi:hypothetical protein PVAND_009702 [Polypedilum vanderplanki]|uniref:Peptidase S1 domain-containing protein n=1 Tax=Polypedilum vanderplanki TaxID=319348 RepID=A0A9J6CDB7_POLVA|nr:hypothetical protein PVAND_009702 [Polypedilum vanderplanki]